MCTKPFSSKEYFVSVKNCFGEQKLSTFNRGVLNYD